VQTSLYLKDSWISTLRVGVRTSLRDVGRGWYNLQENDWEVYQVSKLKKLVEMIKFSMQVFDTEYQPCRDDWCCKNGFSTVKNVMKYLGNCLIEEITGSKCIMYRLE